MHKEKQCRNSFPLSINKVKEPFELIHYDLWGKYHNATNNGSHYILTIVYDYTCGTCAYLMNHKTYTLQHLISFRNLIKRKFNIHIKRIMSDNGTKFTNSNFKCFTQKEGIMHETSSVATPQ